MADVTATVNTITAEVAAYTPLAVQTVVAIQDAVQAPGATKLDIATGIIQASAQTAGTVQVPSVQAIAALVNLIVSIFKAVNFRGFKRTPASTTPAA